MVTMRNHVTRRGAAHARVGVGKFQTSRHNTLRCDIDVLCVSLSPCGGYITLFDPDLDKSTFFKKSQTQPVLLF